ncbi:hypothetical protein [uncultured Methanobrevibacter sp.]|uniref:hypothetical protein n=1 Tax=uncultured Methanobrevibacter sp. TaxID=253161 RepID=UPI0025F7D158|nr:hypothetical protein [uncultured Methanobrevibacter sp.]
MKYGVSTFKNSSLRRLKDKNTTSVGSDDLNLSSSTLGFTNDDCNDYVGFLEEMDKLRAKVRSGDLSDFEELK